jgi:large conductance mechanosensitive channel
MKDFATFIREKGVLGLAVGLIIATASTDIVKSLIENLVQPIINAVIGGVNTGGVLVLAGMTFKIGDFISALINFLAIMLVVYFVFVKSPLNRLDKKA